MSLQAITQYVGDHSRVLLSSPEGNHLLQQLKATGANDAFRKICLFSDGHTLNLGKTRIETPHLSLLFMDQGEEWTDSMLTALDTGILGRISYVSFINQPEREVDPMLSYSDYVKATTVSASPSKSNVPSPYTMHKTVDLTSSPGSPIEAKPHCCNLATLLVGADIFAAVALSDQPMAFNGPARHNMAKIFNGNNDLSALFLKAAGYFSDGDLKIALTCMVQVVRRITTTSRRSSTT